MIRREVLLAYPNFNALVEIYTDASKLQIGTVRSKKGKPIARYSRNMNKAQQNYNTTEKELLSIVATLKTFCNIKLGHQIKFYTDHENLTHKLFSTERVMCWRVILKTFGPELKYIKGENNIVVNALSRLEMSDNQEILNIYELYGYNNKDLPGSAYPIRYYNIAKA